MLDYMKSFEEDGEECGYAKEHIEKCAALLLDYVNALAAIGEPNDEAIMEQIQSVVLALNELNEETDFAMIETDEREALCEVIQTAAVECGLSDACVEENDGDVTGEWREW